jgi:quercetin dioxygenase-like cupin family protein
MDYKRVYSDDEGRSHLAAGVIDLKERPALTTTTPIWQSDPGQAGSYYFTRLPAGWSSDWHPAPRRQFIFHVRGRVEVTTSDGVRIAEPGDITLVEDVSGQGHKTRVVSDEDAVFMAMALVNQPSQDSSSLIL